MQRVETTFISDVLEPMPRGTLAVVVRWLATPVLALLGTVCAILAVTALRYIQMWYIGASEESGYAWIAKHTIEPAVVAFAFVRIGALIAPRHHAAVALVFTTLVGVYLLLWVGAMLYLGTFAFGPVITILFTGIGALAGFASSREHSPVV